MQDVVGHALEAARGIDVIAANCSQRGVLLIVAVLGCAEVVPALNAVAKLVSGRRVETLWANGSDWSNRSNRANWANRAKRSKSSRIASVRSKGSGIGNGGLTEPEALGVIKEAILAHGIGQGKEKGEGNNALEWLKFNWVRLGPVKLD